MYIFWNRGNLVCNGDVVYPYCSGYQRHGFVLFSVVIGALNGCLSIALIVTSPSCWHILDRLKTDLKRCLQIYIVHIVCIEMMNPRVFAEYCSTFVLFQVQDALQAEWAVQARIFLVNINFMDLVRKRTDREHREGLQIL